MFMRISSPRASTVRAACGHVVMSPVAQVMIHLPSSWAAGNQNDMKHEARVLEQITQSILNAACRGSNRMPLRRRCALPYQLFVPGQQLGGAGPGRRKSGGL